MINGRERVIFAKFSTSRKRSNSVKTVLTKKDGDISVRKIALFPEAEDALHEMSVKRELLPDAFPGCDVCGCREEDSALRFDYIRGNNLAYTYWQAYQNNDPELFYSNIERHKTLLLNSSNLGFFTPTEEFESAFGSRYPYEGMNSLRISNFEATAFNIIYEADTDKPVFFDYECIYDFPMPEDLIKYHCIYRTLYLCMPFLRDFIKPKSFLASLELGLSWKVLEKTWRFWRKNFSFGQNQKKMLPPGQQTDSQETENGDSDDVAELPEGMVELHADQGEVPSGESRPASGEEAAESSESAEDTADKPGADEEYVTLSEAKNQYVKRVYTVGDQRVIRNALVKAARIESQKKKRLNKKPKKKKRT